MFPAALTDLASLLSPTWTSVLESMCSICFRNKDVELSSLPLLFVTASKCRYMLMVAAALGTAEQPMVLQGSIAHVSKLHLSGSLHVCIPRGVTWSGISFWRCEELDIRHVHD